MGIYSLVSQVQAATGDIVNNGTQVVEESYLSLIMKGGWIMLPIFLLTILAIYVIIYKYVTLSSIGRSNHLWLSKTLEFIHDNKIDKALFIATEVRTAEASIALAGLKELEEGAQEVETAMELESRIQVGRLEKGLNLLAITASVAPMLGFLGTIFGVIKIFYNIAQTNDLSINTISEGLYEKMICSGAGLLVGIIAYVGYNLLNSRVDRIVTSLDWTSNQILKAVRKTNR